MAGYLLHYFGLGISISWSFGKAARMRAAAAASSRVGVMPSARVSMV
jgi:hypothetical protein